VLKLSASCDKNDDIIVMASASRRDPTQIPASRDSALVGVILWHVLQQQAVEP